MYLSIKILRNICITANLYVTKCVNKYIIHTYKNIHEKSISKDNPKTSKHYFKHSDNICIVDLFVAPQGYPGQGIGQLRPPVPRDAADAAQLHFSPATAGHFRT